MWKKMLCLIAAVLLLGVGTMPCLADNGNTFVYVTDSGKKYHRESCGYLSKSKNAITLQAAVDAGYTPCSRCHPPVLTQQSETTQPPAFSVNPAPAPAPTPAPAPSSSTPSPAEQDRKTTVSTQTAQPPAAASSSVSEWGIKYWGFGLVVVFIAFFVGKGRVHSAFMAEKSQIESELQNVKNENTQLLKKIEKENHLAQVAMMKIRREEMQEYEEHRAALIAKYDMKPVRFLFCIPENITIADGGFPIVHGWKREDYWVYTTYEGKCFHRQSCPTLRWSRPVRIWEACLTHTPCSICKPKTADFLWLTEMHQVAKEAAMYGLRIHIENGIMTLEERTPQSNSDKQPEHTRYSLKMLSSDEA